MKSELEKLSSIVAKLRSKDGCPWDKKQNFKSIREPVLEESYEVIEAIDLKDYKKLKEELGDLLIQIVFLSQLAKEKKYFELSDVIKTACDKLIRRHPHIFSNLKVRGAKEVLKNWEKIKKSENNSKYILDSIPNNLPALIKAKKVQSKVARFGFDWKDVKGPLEKLTEEVKEFEKAVESNKKLKIEEELGDILFTIVNIGRFYNINPESALNRTIAKFIKRFKYIEDRIKKEGKSILNTSLEELDNYWEESKRKIKLEKG